MDSLTEAREYLRGIHNILDDIEAKSEKIDLEVSRQKSRAFKVWCWFWFGHLPDNKGICKRCGTKKKLIDMETIFLPLEKSEILMLQEFMETVSEFVHVPEMIRVHDKVKNICVRKYGEIYEPIMLIDKICSITQEMELGKDHCGFARNQIEGGRGEQALCDVRACTSQLIIDFFPKMSLNKIGARIGGRNHCTVIHHFWMVENIANVNKLYHSIKCQL